MNHEVDIIALHIDILANFQKERKMLNDYEKKLVTIEKTLSYPKLLKRTRDKIQKTWSFLKEKIENIKSRRTESFYLMETAELIETYKEILKKPRVVSFMGELEEENGEKIVLINQYLTLSKKFSPKISSIENVFSKTQVVNDNLCSNCKKETEILDIDGFSVCTVCGGETELIATSSSYKDVERVNVGSKYTYDKRTHFRDCMNQFQGKQNSSIPDKVYIALEREFELHGLLIKSDKKQVKFSRITKEHILVQLTYKNYIYNS